VLDELGNTVWTDSGAPRADGATYLFESLNIPVEHGYTLKALLSVDAGAGGGTIVANSFIDTGSMQNVMLPSTFVNSINFAHKIAVLDQAAPVQNTWYTVLDIVAPVKVFGMGVLIADTGETLEVRVTACDTVITGSGAAVANTDYKILVNTTSAGNTITLSSSALINANQLECRRLKVEVRKTTAAGAGNLKAAVTYGQRG
jgi:hypothetical protein